MNFLKLLFKRFEPRIIEDEVFGKIRFSKGRLIENSYWETELFFKPISQKISLIIHTGNVQPNKTHHLFFQKLTSKYSIVTQEINPLFEEIFNNRRADFKSNSIEDEFILVGISIPNSNKKPLTWEISFDSKSDQNHMFTVEMNNWNPTGHVNIDG